MTAVPHGAYSTYAGSTQSQLTFYTGTAATGIYGVIRNYGKVTQKSLVKLGKLLAAAMSGSSALRERRPHQRLSAGVVTHAGDSLRRGLRAR